MANQRNAQGRRSVEQWYVYFHMNAKLKFYLVSLRLTATNRLVFLNRKNMNEMETKVNIEDILSEIFVIVFRFSGITR